MKANIILLNGESVDLLEWQKMYNLTPGTSKIGRYFDIGEPSFKDGLTISEGIIRLLDVVRYLWGSSININSLDRTEEDQERLRKEGYRAAKISAHVVKLAGDIDTISNDETYELLECIERAELILGYKVRKGFKVYMGKGHTVVHVDVCPMYYAPGRVWNHMDHPKVWEKVIEW